MRRTLALALGAVLLVTTVPVVTAGTNPSVQGVRRPAAITDAPADASTPAGMQTVIVTLRTRADLRSIGGSDRRTRLIAAVRALRDHAVASQRPLLAVLRLRAAQGRVARHTSFWIFNGLSSRRLPT